MSLEHSPARQAAAYTIQEFCDSHRLSRAKLYSLWEQNKSAAKPFGEGPHYFLVGDHSRRIDNEAAANWRAAREAAAREQTLEQA
jgi:hypothetical protein